MQKRIEELNVALVKVDLTEANETLAKELSRTDRANIPVNMVYSADPNAPAILLEELITPDDALKALDLVAKK